MHGTADCTARRPVPSTERVSEASAAKHGVHARACAACMQFQCSSCKRCRRRRLLSTIQVDHDAILRLQVREVAKTYVPVWELVAELLAELDVLASFADVATSSPAPFVQPEMLPADAGEIKLVQSRHPCLELQDGVDIIPNDCELTRGDSWYQLITGPNMGGKSTYIRQARPACDWLAPLLVTHVCSVGLCNFKLF